MARGVLFTGILRIETNNGWTLIEHREHARLAGEFARHWGNDDFEKPEPFDDILMAVSRHDDAWAERDANPCLTREGRPSAFSRTLVGKYSSFEEIDFLEYLDVRGRATEAVAEDNLYAAIIVSMHSENLLTEQADLRSLSVAERQAHESFINGQRLRQQQLSEAVAKRPGGSEQVASTTLRRAFEFLQACDHLSLLACVGFDQVSTLRHRHPLRSGQLVPLECWPVGNGIFRISPYPFNRDDVECVVPYREVPGRTFSDEKGFRTAFCSVPVRNLVVRIVR
jgi:hypothetical protein